MKDGSLKRVILSDIFNLQMGKTPSRNEKRYWNDGDHDWISIGDLSSFGKYVGKTKETISDDAIKESGIKIIPSGTVIMSFKLSIGKVSITKDEVYSNEAIMAFIDRKIFKIDNNYIYHMFKNKDWSSGSNRAVMGVTLNKNALNNVEINLPSIELQRHIAYVLDKVEGIVQNRKSQIELLDSIVKSRFIEMFEDYSQSTIAWDDVFNVTTGKVKSNAMIENGIYPFFTCSKEKLWINEYAFDCEALLLAGNNAAGIYDVKHYSGKFNAYQRTYVITLKNNSNRYEFYKIQLEGKLSYLKSVSIGTNTKYLTLGILKKLIFINPSVELQDQFADFVKQVDKSKFAIQQSLKELEMLYNSLSQQYFSCDSIKEVC